MAKKKVEAVETEVVTPEKEDNGYKARPVTIRDLEILRHIIVTEKSQNLLKEQNVLTLNVAKGTKKSEVKQAVQAYFHVKVDHVNVINVDGKTKRVGRFEGKTSSFRKAYVFVNKAFNLSEVASEAQELASSEN